MMNEFATQAGLQIIYKEYHSFDGIWNKPSLHQADVAIGGISNAKGRGRRTTEWSIPYFYVHRSVLFQKKKSVRTFPSDVHGIIISTYNSTGWTDGEIRLDRIHKKRFLVKGTTDKEDISELLHGKVQGLLRGDFVSKAIVKTHPELGYTTWDAEPDILPSDGEVFSYPTKQGSGIAMMLSTFITDQIDRGEMKKRMKRFHLL
jgi:ABC-type amino acid transport substrate-binding protein